MIITNTQLRKVINEELKIILFEQRVELFEARLDRDISNLINEGVLDIIKAGYGKAKELAGAAKKQYDAAVEKLGEFYLNFGIQTWGLLQQAKGAFGAVGAALHSAAKKIDRFCNVHPVLCAAGKCLLIIGACAVLVGWSASSAEAAVRVYADAQGQGGHVLDTYQLNGTYGCLEILGDAQGGETLGSAPQQIAVEAFKFLKEAAASSNVVDLNTANEGVIQTVERCLNYMVELNQEHGSRALDSLVRQGERTAVWTKEIYRELNGVVIQNDQIEFLKQAARQ